MGSDSKRDPWPVRYRGFEITQDEGADRWFFFEESRPMTGNSGMADNVEACLRAIDTLVFGDGYGKEKA